MNIHEYQAKALFEKFGVAVPRGAAAKTPEDFISALATLPEEKRELLVLSRFQNLKYEQIAGILACDVGTVKVRVYRAIKALSQIFFELSGEKAS